MTDETQTPMSARGRSPSLDSLGNLKAYSDLPYDGDAYRDSHPSHIFAVASLLGLDATPPERARVLELGCATGRNIIPMAARFPNAQFVGLDLAPGQIASANKGRETLGLENLSFIAADLGTVGEELGTFDYIIAHGVFSWLPDNARMAFLRLCGVSLSSNGIAYVSYNTYPGWRRREALREMMLYHVRAMDDMVDRVRSARALAEFLSAASSPSDPTYKLWLHEELKALTGSTDTYVFHEFLASHNFPMYFSDFIDHAHQEGLAFAGEAWLPSNFGGILPLKLAQDLWDLVGGDRISFEQYQDFVLNRPFRKTLLCRHGRRGAGSFVPEALERLHVLSDFTAVRDDGVVTRTWVRGETRLVDVNPSTDALLRILAERWPSSMSVPELLVAYGRAATDDSAASREIGPFCDDLCTLVVREIVYVAGTPVVAGSEARHPRVFPWVAAELAEGARHVTSVHHVPVAMSNELRELARLADGTRDAAALLEGLLAAISRGALTLPTRDATPAELKAGLAAAIGRGVLRLRHLGVLA